MWCINFLKGLLLCLPISFLFLELDGTQKQRFWVAGFIKVKYDHYSWYAVGHSISLISNFLGKEELGLGPWILINQVLVVTTMQTTICFTNHGGVGQFSVPQPPQATPLPWWIGSQSLFEGHSNGEDQLPAASRQLHHAVVPRVGPGPAVTEEKGTVTTSSQWFFFFYF